MCSFAVAMAIGLWEAAHQSADSDQVELSELWGRLGIFAAVAVCFALAGIGTFRAWRCTARLRKGQCPTCGYDLRATSDRCPECGSPVPARILSGTDPVSDSKA